MTSASNTLTSVADRFLEISVLGSFSALGIRSRSGLHDWAAVDADLSGQRIVLTGGSSGIGRATVHKLVDLGARVTLTSRSAERAADVAREINDGAAGDGEALGAALDTASPSSIESFARNIVEGKGDIHSLIHNAGALVDDYQTNDNGMELTLASHLVGPFQLTKLLLPHMSVGGRVLWMSSGGMYTQRLDVNELEMGPSDFNGTVAYARAKRAQVELVRLLGPELAPGIVMHSMHPGWVDTDGVSSALPGFGKLMGPLLRSAEEGADTMVWMAAGGADLEEPGSFFLDRASRGTEYLPGRGATPVARELLRDWLEAATPAASVSQ